MSIQRLRIIMSHPETKNSSWWYLVTTSQGYSRCLINGTRFEIRELSVSHSMGHGQHPNLKTDMDEWSVKASYYPEDIITFISSLLIGMKQFLQKLLNYDILCNSWSWVNADQIMHHSVLQRWSLKEFRHSCSCEFSAFIVAFKDLTGRQYFLSAHSQGLSQKTGYWSSCVETNFVHQISHSSETYKERQNHPRDPLLANSQVDCTE